jgi:hypothetical protein
MSIQIWRPNKKLEFKFPRNTEPYEEFVHFLLDCTWDILYRYFSNLRWEKSVTEEVRTVCFGFLVYILTSFGSAFILCGSGSCEDLNADLDSGSFETRLE